ncbi:hypothetical protein [Brevibacterium album]|uniref:hypothetical protein n=1 Tax=Brevibacterium album TaxID=417948 RepID=UPI00041E6889|nr:hypothetical protein [Brevibacterium album]
MMLRAGYFADGIWKALVGAGMLILLPLLTERLGAPAWLLCVTAVPVLASAGAEMLYAVRSGEAGRVPHLIAYDALWVFVSVLAVVLASAGGSAGTAWAVWLGYQLVAAPIVAVIFFHGAGLHVRSR